MSDEIKISKKIYRRMIQCEKLANKRGMLVEEVDDYLKNKGVNIDELRESDAGGYVDMVDYGRGCIAKSKLEKLFFEFKIKHNTKH